MLTFFSGSHLVRAQSANGTSTQNLDWTTNSQDLAIWWTFDSLSQGTVVSRGSLPLVGKLVNFPDSSLVVGLFSNAFSFTTRSMVTTPVTPPLDVSKGFTLSLWLKKNETEARQGTTVAQGAGVDGSSWRLGMGTNGVAEITFVSGQGQISRIGGLSPAIDVADGQWHFLAATYEPSTRWVDLIVDETVEAGGYPDAWGNTPISSFTFGRDIEGNGGFILDEARFFSADTLRS